MLLTLQHKGNVRAAIDRFDNDLIIEIQGLVDRIKSLELEITILKDARCPYCEQEYRDNQKKIDEKVAEQKLLAKEYKAKSDELKQSKSRRSDIEAHVDQTKCRFSTMVEWQKSKSQYERLLAELTRIKGEKNPHQKFLWDAEKIQLQKRHDDTEPD